MSCFYDNKVGFINKLDKLNVIFIVVLIWYLMKLKGCIKWFIY